MTLPLRNQPQHVTFTGVDKRTDLAALRALSDRYPIEWGILLGSIPGKTPRHPDVPVLREFSNMRGVGKAMHLCGYYAEQFQKGNVPHFLFNGIYDRVQVNRRELDYDDTALAALAVCEPYRIIRQWRGAEFPDDTKLDYLFDLSGGRGEVPDTVPPGPKGMFVGYAGGITPDNVVDWLDKIEGGNFWIDMESGVRTDDWLDLDKCEAVCRAIWGESA